MKKHITAIIHGRVQGVWYRASTKEVAVRLGINGMVRNQADGSVYAEFEGTEPQLEQMLKWCWEGPLLAQVTAVEKKELPLKGYTDFTIR